MRNINYYCKSSASFSPKAAPRRFLAMIFPVVQSIRKLDGIDVMIYFVGAKEPAPFKLLTHTQFILNLSMAATQLRLLSSSEEAYISNPRL